VRVRHPVHHSSRQIGHDIAGRGDTRHCKSYLFIAFLNSSRSPDHFSVLNVKKFPKMSEIKNIFVLLVVYLAAAETS